MTHLLLEAPMVHLLAILAAAAAPRAAPPVVVVCLAVQVAWRCCQAAVHLQAGAGRGNRQVAVRGKRAPDCAGGVAALPGCGAPASRGSWGWVAMQMQGGWLNTPLERPAQYASLSCAPLRALDSMARTAVAAWLSIQQRTLNDSE